MLVTVGVTVIILAVVVVLFPASYFFLLFPVASIVPPRHLISVLVVVALVTFFLPFLFSSLYTSSFVAFLLVFIASPRHLTPLSSLISQFEPHLPSLLLPLLSTLTSLRLLTYPLLILHCYFGNAICSYYSSLSSSPLLSSSCSVSSSLVQIWLYWFPLLPFVCFSVGFVMSICSFLLLLLLICIFPFSFLPALNLLAFLLLILLFMVLFLLSPFFFFIFLVLLISEFLFLFLLFLRILIILQIGVLRISTSSDWPAPVYLHHPSSSYYFLTLSYSHRLVFGVLQFFHIIVCFLCTPL